ncbi:MAG: hypothetical protein IPJ40_23445 [Saprospirales bacterium]|nr:hypothetical protein [Saprospirales bacterium]
MLNTLYLKKGDLFSQDNYDRTNRQLSNLGIFRFVTLKAEPDPDIAGQINFRIYLTPNKRFEFGTDLEVNTSTPSSLGAVYWAFPAMSPFVTGTFSRELSYSSPIWRAGLT